MSNRAVWSLGGVALALTFAGLIWADQADEQRCRDMGGRRISKATVGYGLASNGQMAPAFGSVTFCLSSDGRVLGE